MWNFLNFFQDFLGWVYIFGANFLTIFVPITREFPEVFETPPTFISSLFQRGVIAKNQERAFFLGHPVCETTIQEPLSHPYVTYLQTYTIQIFLQVLQVLLLIGWLVLYVNVKSVGKFRDEILQIRTSTNDGRTDRVPHSSSTIYILICLPV